MSVYVLPTCVLIRKKSNLLLNNVTLNINEERREMKLTSSQENYTFLVSFNDLRAKLVSKKGDAFNLYYKTDRNEYTTIKIHYLDNDRKEELVDTINRLLMAEPSNVKTTSCSLPIRCPDTPNPRKRKPRLIDTDEIKILDNPYSQYNRDNSPLVHSTPLKKILINEKLELPKITVEAELKDKYQSLRLHNIGNSCYMNSVFQVLASNFMFIKTLKRLVKNIGISKLAEGTEESIVLRVRAVKSVFSLLASMNHHINDENKLTKETMMNIRNRIGLVYDRFSNNEQQDAHEFLIHLLSMIDDICNHKGTKELNISHPNYIENTKAIKKLTSIAQLNATYLFQIKPETRFHCNSCMMTRLSTSNHYQLDMPVNANSGENIQSLLEKSLKSTRDETIECEGCREKGGIISHRIVEFPKTLIVTLKRYEVGDDYVPRKTNAQCQVNMRLNLNKLTMFNEDLMERRDEIDIFAEVDEVVNDSQNRPELLPSCSTENNDTSPTIENNKFTFSLLGGMDDAILEPKNRCNGSDVEEDIELINVKEVDTIPFRPLNSEEKVLEILSHLNVEADKDKIRKHLERFPVLKSLQVSPKENPFIIREIEADGNCFYRSISWWLTASDEHHGVFRKMTAKLLKDHPDMFRSLSVKPYEQLLAETSMDCEWVNEVGIIAMSTLLNVPIWTFVGKRWIKCSPRTSQGYRNELKLCEDAIYLNNKYDIHYEPVLACKSNSQITSRNKYMVMKDPDDDSNKDCDSNDGSRRNEGSSNTQRNARKRAATFKGTYRGMEDGAEVLDYRLKAAVCHQGVGIHSGHYFAYRLLDENTWLRCSDTNIQEVQERDVIECTSRTAYLLFYDKV